MNSVRKFRKRVRFLNDRKGQKIKAMKMMKNHTFRNVIKQLNLICSKKNYQFDWDAKKYSDIIQEYMKPFTKTFHEIWTKYFEELNQSKLIKEKFSED